MQNGRKAKWCAKGRRDRLGRSENAETTAVPGEGENGDCDHAEEEAPSLAFGQ
jgi:hypothetical protein